MNVYEAIETRRSTRAYRPDTVPQDLLERIVSAGRLAPSGGNSQTTHLIVIRDRTVLDALAELVQREFAAMEYREDMYKSLKHSVYASKQGTYRFHYDAPVLIAAANDIHYGNNLADCAIAVENMMLLANELNLGSCWINQLKWLNENEAVNEYLYGLGLEAHERVYAAVAVGFAATEDGLPVRKPLPRTGNPVTWV